MKFHRFNRKVAFALSACMMIVWALMGAGTTVAWFTDTTPVAKNTFIIGELKLEVDYKNDLMTDYASVDSQKGVFNDQALYEPGYTQVVFLRIKNAGTMDFDYKLSVTDNGFVDSETKEGIKIHLPEHLKFGVIFAASEPELIRELARSEADLDMKLDLYDLKAYSENDTEPVVVNGERYAAIIIYMPEEVGNEANHATGLNAPQVSLGLTIFAQQAGTMNLNN